MKNIKYIILSLLFISNMVYAEDKVTFTPELVCDKSEIITTTEEVTCTLNLTIKNPLSTDYTFTGSTIYFKLGNSYFTTYNIIKGESIIESS